jgi:Lar family restriction alleviation protein
MLIPCPFCGSTVHLYVDTVPALLDLPAFAFVMCLHCKIAGPIKDTSSSAILAWNHRPQSSLNPSSLSSPITKN